MVEIRLEDIARVERLLITIKSGRTSADEVARQVLAVPALAQRLTRELRDRQDHSAVSVRQAITLLGMDRVRAHIKALLDHWLQAVEQPGKAQITGDPRRTPIPRFKGEDDRRRTRLTA